MQLVSLILSYRSVRGLAKQLNRTKRKPHGDTRAFLANSGIRDILICSHTYIYVYLLSSFRNPLNNDRHFKQRSADIREEANETKRGVGYTATRSSGNCRRVIRPREEQPGLRCDRRAATCHLASNHSAI